MANSGVAPGAANTWLDSWSAFWAQCHTGLPGTAGTTNRTTGATATAGTRQQIGMGAASSATAGTAVKSSTGSASWANWDGGSVTISDVSLWSSSGSGNPATGGTYQMSATLATAKAVANGDTFNLTSLSVSLTGLCS